MKIIESVEAITTDWLSQALAAKYPGTCVTSFHIGTVIPGTATKVRLLLNYNRAGHEHRLPPTMWLKAGLEEHSASPELLSVYAGEACFYREIAPTLNLDLPEAFFVGFDPVTDRSALLIEDLLARNAGFGTALKPLTPESAIDVLDQLAKLHAAYWGNSSRLRAFSNLSGGGALLAGGVVAGLFDNDNWERCMSLPRGRFLRGALSEREVLRDKMLKMLKFDEEHAHCLVHGDPHLGNLYFTPDSGAGYLDWQTTMHGFWAHDVADFITTSLTIEDRRASEQTLIQSYLNSLNTAGVQMEFEEAWREYSRHALYNLCWGLCRPEWQPEEVCEANFERASAAIVDLGSLNNW